ncbi:MAG: nucleotidyl transferase AbiEii/AbiGii toxin family protein [Anaerolineales bacterium]|uniref:Nucleotidyl transferase AbiEii/AbiGii toxin family protein n=1 Tax=Candidatus Desulfolinea nitratireducens TaxID=2841698 RepID=A0A8J6NRV9_9CHLR|nr:nucleotidyl transferase AbiEii/AbiGii toxin family protein [Candidatus Desulfolinea nitratireducens]
MNPNFYKKTLYPLQDKVLKQINQLETGFYLTGGTAASRAYLQHRYSDDLDFFVNDAPDFTLWSERVIHALSTTKNWQLEIHSRYERFVRLHLIQAETTLKLEFINDVPSRVGEISVHPLLGRLDSAKNILANKLTALLSREEPKDLADIWGFSTKLNLSLKEAITGAQGKAAGIFPADLSRVLLSASQEDFKLIRWIEAPSTQEFIQDLHQLGESLILLDK